MKKKKNIKKEKTIKNKYLGLVIIVLLLAFAVVGVNRILGNDEVSLVCEDKKGNLFVPRDKDGKLDDCGKHGESVTFKFNNSTSTGNEKETGFGNAVGSGYARFADGNSVLTNDGKIWQYKGEGNTVGVWKENTTIAQLTPDVVNKIIFWEKDSFLTSDGYFVLQTIVDGNPSFSKYIEAGLPIETTQ
ncbi:MAG: hypothetical protein PHE32_00700 [Candidatus Shapirobacteria bacterium]|nr:hypothetical protein [Candidatus Shapirobacteria bacterium]